MSPPTPQYRFRFDPAAPLAEAELTLQLALVAVEGLVGRARVRLDVDYAVEPATRSILVDASTPAGAALVGVFTSLVLKEFGEDAVTVGRVPQDEGRAR